MGLFDFLKGSGNQKNQVPENHHLVLYAPADGEFLDIDSVDDPVFSEKMMGEGYGLNPVNGEVYSPVVGKVTSVFPTKHAIGIETEIGLEILVHIGIDTVELEGKPFEVHVTEGESVDQNTHLATVDLSVLEAENKGKTIVVVITNSDEISFLDLTAEGKQSHGDQVGSAKV